MTTEALTLPKAHDRVLSEGVRALSDSDLFTAVLGPTAGSNNTRQAVAQLLETTPIAELAWASPDQLMQQPGIGPARAAALAAAFELGRRAGWSPPLRGDRAFRPNAIYELLRHVAYSPQEEFWIVLLDSHLCLLKPHRVAIGSLTQCPVSPRDVLREAVRAGADSVVFVHNHPSGSIAPSDADVDLTDRLRASAELVGLHPRDHIIIAAGGYFSFVEQARWRR